MARKTAKICLVCGNEFKGTDGKITCTTACRTAMSRMIAKGKKPEFWLMAKSKGQKMPTFIPKPKTDKPKKIVSIEPPKKEVIIQIKETVIETPIVAKELTLEEKLKHNHEIEKKISVEKNKKSEVGVHPRLFKLYQEDKIAELRNQIII